MQSSAATPAEYLAELPEDRRATLNALGKIIRKIAPKISAGMNYGMLEYSLGEPVFCLASQKQYLALYAAPDILAKYKPRLGKVSCGKSCLRFKSLDQLPLDVVAAMLTECVSRVQQGKSG